MRRGLLCIITLFQGFLGFANAAIGDKFYAKSIAVAKQVEWPSEQLSSFTLTPETPIATVDCGSEVAGYAFIEIDTLESPVQLEIKYSEPYSGLEQPWGDGPYTFTTSLANVVRVETFNVTATGNVTSPLVQGGQRWQSIKLVAGDRVTISQVGFTSSVSVADPEEFAAHFSSDDAAFNAIWKLGQKATTLACIEEGTQGPVWNIDPVKGTFVYSTKASPNWETGLLGNYTLDFDASIERSGVWWTVAQGVNNGAGIHLMLVSELPEDTTLANVNKNFTPANSILLAQGYGFVNQTTLTSYYLDTFSVPFDVHEKEWYQISTSLSSDSRLAVQINDTKVFDISLLDYYTGGSAVTTTGSFGFGAYQDQSAWVRNARVHDSANGSLLYTDSLSDDSALERYGTHASFGTVCLDGPKRDRLVWMGDFYHTSRIIGTSTNRPDWSRGTLSFLLDTQIDNGLLNMAPSIGYDPSTTIEGFTTDGTYMTLADYQPLGFLSFYHLIKQTDDLHYASQTWPKWKKQLDWMLNTVNETDGLIDVEAGFLGSGSGGSAVSCLFLEALNSAAEIAVALNDKEASTKYQDSAEKLSSAINTHLWNDELGVYSLSRSQKTDFSVTGIGLCITSGAANSSQTSRSVSPQILAQLRLGPGYKDDTTANSSDPSTNISPNTNGFLLPALFMGNATMAARDLLRSAWGAMLSEGVEDGMGNDTTATGASWEYLDQSGGPGLGLFTSLSHPWGGAATYILTEWAAGLQPATGPRGFGYKNWVLLPETGIQMGLRNASAQIVTGSGDLLSVGWQLHRHSLEVQIEAPAGTTGRIKLRGTEREVKGGKPQTIDISV